MDLPTTCYAPTKSNYALHKYLSPQQKAQPHRVHYEHTPYYTNYAKTFTDYPSYPTHQPAQDYEVNRSPTPVADEKAWGGDINVNFPQQPYPSYYHGPARDYNGQHQSYSPQLNRNDASQYPGEAFANLSLNEQNQQRAPTSQIPLGQAIAYREKG
jgi:hypothetical protein